MLSIVNEPYELNTGILSMVCINGILYKMHMAIINTSFLDWMRYKAIDRHM